MGLKVLSLFDGMACGMLAFKELNISIDKYVAYEIDKYAIKTAKYNFPEIEEKGDVFDADFTEYKDVDFLIGGSPCTYWSIAQKNNRETEASGLGWELFSQYIRALNEAKPKYFIYENNKSMSNSIRDSIRKSFGFEETCLNSALVSPQQRYRYYWVGKRNEDGTYSKIEIKQPEDSKIYLRDILDGFNYPLNTTKEGKSQTLKGQYINTSPRNILCYTSTTYGATGIAELVRAGSLLRPDGKPSTSAAFRFYDINGKGRYLCANGEGSGAKTGLYAIPVVVEDGTVPKKAKSQADGKLYDVYLAKEGMIYFGEECYPVKLADGYYIIRKLTVNECKRL